MKKDSFYQFIMKEFSKNSFNRMGLPSFTKVLRKKAQDVPSSQLLFVYRELFQRQRTYNLHLAMPDKKLKTRGNNVSYQQKETVVNVESYQKQVIICLEQIIIKEKQKEGYGEGFDSCKLLYYRLLNAIEYNFPHINLLEQFREEFVWKDVGPDVIEYVDLVEKDPLSLGSLYVETVNLIVQTISEQLQNIDVLQLPYLRSVLSRAQSYGSYNIDQQLISRVDSLINENKYVYSFKELKSSLMGDHKHHQNHMLYSFMSKDPIEKRLNYLYLDQKNNNLRPDKSQDIVEKKYEYGLPGKAIDQQNIGDALKMMQELNLMGVYVDIFQEVHRQKRILSTSMLRYYIHYHFKYFVKSGNVNCSLDKINSTVQSAFQSPQKMAEKGLKFQHLQILKLFYVNQILSRKYISSSQLTKSHQFLEEQLKTLNSTRNLKVQNLNKIFENSLRYFVKIEESRGIDKIFGQFIKKVDEKVLSNLINEELSILSAYEKKFMMQQLILSYVNLLIVDSTIDRVETVGRIMSIVTKLQYKKFSNQFSNVQKLLSLMEQKVLAAKIDFVK